MYNLPFISIFVHAPFKKADLLLRSQSMNDSEGDNCKLRRRKLSFESEGDRGNLFYLKSKNRTLVTKSFNLNACYASDFKNTFHSGF